MYCFVFLFVFYFLLFSPFAYFVCCRVTSFSPSPQPWTSVSFLELCSANRDATRNKILLNGPPCEKVIRVIEFHLFFAFCFPNCLITTQVLVWGGVGLFPNTIRPTRDTDVFRFAEHL